MKSLSRGKQLLRVPHTSFSNFIGTSPYWSLHQSQFVLRSRFHFLFSLIRMQYSNNGRLPTIITDIILSASRNSVKNNIVLHSSFCRLHFQEGSSQTIGWHLASLKISCAFGEVGFVQKVLAAEQGLPHPNPSVSHSYLEKCKFLYSTKSLWENPENLLVWKAITQ